MSSLATSSIESEYRDEPSILKHTMSTFEFRKTFRSKPWIAALLLGITLQFVYLMFSEYCWGISIYENSCNAFDGFLWAMAGPLGLFFPILAILPRSDNYLVNRGNGYLSLLLLRNRQWPRFLINEVMCTAVATVAALVLSSAISFGLIACIYPLQLMKPEEARMAPNYFTKLYWELPLLFIAARIGLLSLAGSAFAVLGLAVSAFTDKRILIYAVPIVLDSGLRLFFAIMGMPEWGPDAAVAPEILSRPSLLGMLLPPTLTLILSAVVFVAVESRRKVRA